MDLYRALGLRAFPLLRACRRCRADPAFGKACRYCRGGKRPAYRGWQHDDAPRWNRFHNVGLVTGQAPLYLVVLDFDEQHLVEEVLGERPTILCNRTLVARTRRGWHVYARHEGVPSGRPLPGVDVRGVSGQVVAPPSVHVLGTAYTFLREDVGIAPLVSIAPLSLLEKVVPAVFNTNTNTVPPPPPRGGEVAREPRAVVGLEPVPFEPEEPDLEVAFAWLRAGAPALRAHLEVLEGVRPPLPREKGGRSRSDFVVSLALVESGMPTSEIAGFLLRMDGSKAAERGKRYACRTALRAYAEKRGPWQPGR